MPYIASEDYPNKRIYLHSDTALMPEIDVIEIYREHRARRRLNVNGERSFSRMVTAFGNDQFGASDFTPRYVNLEDGVRLIPHDADHRPLITPTPLISVSESLSGRDLFDRSNLTPGVEVDVDYQPEKTGFREVNVGGSFTNDDRSSLVSAELYSRYHDKVYFDSVADVDGDGTKNFPFNNLQSAINAISLYSLSTIVVQSLIVVDGNINGGIFNNIHFKGTSAPLVMFINNPDVHGCTFEQCSISGVHSGSVVARNSLLVEELQLSGFYDNCSLFGVLGVSNNATVLLQNPTSYMAGAGQRPSLDLAGSLSAKVSVRGHKGGLNLLNSTSSQNAITVEMNPASVTADVSCTAGDIVVRGVGKFVDNTPTKFVTDESMSPETASAAIFAEEGFTP